LPYITEAKEEHTLFRYLMQEQKKDKKPWQDKAGVAS
jgi:hypothetical protein